MGSEIYYDVRIWWPATNSYGGSHGRLDLESAKREAAHSVKLGYGTPDNPIHILLITEPKIVAVIGDLADVPKGRYMRDQEDADKAKAMLDRVTARTDALSAIKEVVDGK